jgi:hypothetical protein
MIECIFTIDYEIYGNGEGSLKELAYEPAERLVAIFRKWNVRFVPFIEAAELEMIEANGTDYVVDLVRQQIRTFHTDGFEVGLHLHPQWYNAKYENRKWLLDYNEYNLCKLTWKRIDQIINRSINYLRGVLGIPDFTPLSFRAGNWLFQPATEVASILAKHGIKIDSSVFKGGMQRQHKLDYRPALKNGYYWRFQNDINIHDPNGVLVEIPTYTMMVPFWKMLTTKRIAAQRKGISSPKSSVEKLNRLPDYLRLRYPLKLDFCRLTINELIFMVDRIIGEDRESPTVYKPIVTIGHTKDLHDLDVVESLLSYLKSRNIKVTTFNGVYARCQTKNGCAA